MTTIILAVTIGCLLIDRAVSTVLAHRERKDWTHALHDANRKAIRAALAKSGLEYERAESIAEAVEQAYATPQGEPEPAPEGLG